MSYARSVKEYLNIIFNLTEYQCEIEQQEKERITKYVNNDNYSNNYYEKLLAQKELNNKTSLEQLSLNELYAISENEYKFYYRGHYKTSYSLIPSIFRGNDWNKEDWYYHEIMVRCPEHFQYSTHLDKLVTMQHYECPTRLLDVTSNPLVALYFACNNFSCPKCNNSKEGEVIVFPVRENEISYSDSDRALMLSCIPRFSIADKKELENIAYSSIFKDSFRKKTNGLYDDVIVERFFHEVTTELPSFKRQIKPMDLLMPLFVQPNKTNGRIIKQDGAFIISGLSKNAEDAEKKLKALEHTRIRISNKEGILKELSLLGINEATLFPEVDKVAHYLKESK